MIRSQGLIAASVDKEERKNCSRSEKGTLLGKRHDMLLDLSVGGKNNHSSLTCQQSDILSKLRDREKTILAAIEQTARSRQLSGLLRCSRLGCTIVRVKKGN